jgi:peptidoglycan/LPS O-acetylase OafA/YrhL
MPPDRTISPEPDEQQIVTDQVAPASKSSRIRELDFCRALAILGVLANHLLVATPALVTHTPSGLPHWLDVTLNLGWLGVDLFFILSGFLITTILLGSRGSGTARYFGRFYERRALRILPVYLIVVALLAIAYIPTTGPGYFALCIAFAANLSALFPSIMIPNGGGPLWSLAVEEQFYLVWPWLILAFDRSKLWLVLLAVLIVVPILRTGHTDARIELTWFRCDGLALGALLALWFTSKFHNPRNDDRLALGLLAIAVLLILATFPFGGLHGGTLSRATRISEAICFFGALVVFAISHTGRPESAFMRVPFFLLTADFSYCLYLIHTPLIDVYQAVVGRFFPALPDALGPLGTNLLRTAIILVASYALAALSNRFIEQPFLRMGRHERAHAIAPATR